MRKSGRMVDLLIVKFNLEKEEDFMTAYKLLTPGPLTTTETVKRAMLVDHCTWDDDYKVITTKITKKLLELAHCNKENYECVLMQGSGSFGVEAILSSAIGPEDKLLILTNGAYGNRMEEMSRLLKLNYEVLNFPYDERPCPQKVADYLAKNPDNTVVAMVHCETTTGILNDIEAISKVVKAQNQMFVVDAMSSFGGMEIGVKDLGIDFLVSSANKCIQGVPGFSFIIAKTEELKKCEHKERSLSLGLYSQWKEMQLDGKWRFTSPTHVVLAFEQALKELEEEGGIAARHARYQKNMELLRSGFEKLGIKPFLEASVQSPIIATFEYPQGDFSFVEMYNFIKVRGYAIYPGKLLDLNTFRVGVIGEIYSEDIEKLIEIMEAYMTKETHQIEAVIFDWAGTTVDYGCFAPVKAFLETFSEYGLAVTLDEIREPMGALKRTHIERMLAMPRIQRLFEEKYGRSSHSTDVDQMIATFTEKLMLELSQHTTVKPYILDVVGALRDKGIKIGSTTGYTSNMLAPVAAAAKKAGYEPDSMVTPDDTGGIGRPEPLMLQRNLELLGVRDLSRVIKVGDTVSDIEEGKQAGVLSVGVIEGSSVMGLSEAEYEALSAEEKLQEISRTRKVYEQAGADKVILHMGELLELVG